MKTPLSAVWPRKLEVLALSCLVTFAAGCVSNSSKPADESQTPASGTPVAATEAAPASKPASKTATTATPATTGTGTGTAAAGMDNQGNVIDPTKVESGSGQKVKVGEWEGEITGKPVKNSKFSRLKIGMSMKEATDLAGQPTDQGAYMTGKAWIPFYFGGDRHRYELTYKGHGRLIFAGGNMGNLTGGNLIWIIHSAKETGYR